MNSVEKSFYFVIIVLLFQVTRNINTPIYVSVLFGAYLILYVNFFYNIKQIYNNKIQISSQKLIFLMTIIWIPIITIFNLRGNDFFIAISRFLVTFPFILFCLIYNSYSKIIIIKVLRALCIFMSIASMSIPYQIIFGKISFLADSGYREGLERYSSLAGSLTALGTLGGIAFAILLFSGNYLFSKKEKVLLIICTSLGMLMSMQKAAVINIIICIVLWIFIMNNNKKILRKIIYVTIGFIVVYLIYISLKGSNFQLYIDSILKYTFSDSSLGVEEDLITRMWDYPNKVIRYHNMKLFDYITGIGLGALSGTMGLPNLPMAHNNYFDLLFSGGIVHLFIYLTLLIKIPFTNIYKFIKRVKVNNLQYTYSIIILLILINMLIGAAGFYQPIMCIFSFFIICSYSKLQEIK